MYRQIYALHSGDKDYRYVGKTTRTIQARLNDHLREAERGSPSAKHEWMRQVGLHNVHADLIAELPEVPKCSIGSNEALSVLEKQKIAELFEAGYKLLNVQYLEPVDHGPVMMGRHVIDTCMSNHYLPITFKAYATSLEARWVALQIRSKKAIGPDYVSFVWRASVDYKDGVWRVRVTCNPRKTKRSEEGKNNDNTY